MKRFVAISTIALLGVAALSSCKKEYTCVCQNSYTWNGQVFNYETSEDFRTTRNDAHDRCGDKKTRTTNFVPGAGMIVVDIESDCELR